MKREIEIFCACLNTDLEVPPSTAFRDETRGDRDLKKLKTQGS